jgi:integrase/recombinase XerD
MSELRFRFPELKSAVGKLIEDFIIEKMALHYRYLAETKVLVRFDDFLVEKGLAACTLPQQLVQEWLQIREYESPKSQRRRFNLTLQFAKFMVQRGYEAYLPDSRLQPVVRDYFAPYVFTRDEVRRLIEAADHIRRTARAPCRHIIMPEIYRLLYGCGLRIGEAVRLTRRDSDLEQGILTIRDTKFGKDRLVPMVPRLAKRLKRMSEQLDRVGKSPYLFPGRDGGHITRDTVYLTFRDLLGEIGISHGVGKKGPRIHDLRHTFACHRLVDWYREGADLSAKLPLLATYMGHRTLFGTQRYLHLTMELSAEFTKRIDDRLGHTIPTEEQP